MARRVLVLMACGTCLCACAHAEPILTIDAPAAYTPGHTFEVTVRLTGAEDLALYNIEAVVSSSGGTAGEDFHFDSAIQPASRYVFDGQVNDGFVYNILASATDRITLSDLLTSGGVNTVVGVNDLVAIVTIATAPTMTETLTIGIVRSSLELDAPGGPIWGFDALKASLPAPTISIPEPAALSLLAVGSAPLLRRTRSR